MDRGPKTSLNHEDSTAVAQTPRLKASGSLITRVLGLHSLLTEYEKMPLAETPWDFGHATLQQLHISLDHQGESLDALAEPGPALVFANHPFGGVEGVILAALCGTLRHDFKLLANEMLTRIPELAPMIIPVDVSGKNQRENMQSVRQAVRHVEQGGALGIFPSGMVAHWQMNTKTIVEPVWQSLCGRLARQAHIKAIPIYFKGRNSMLFHAAGCIHPMLRTVLLPRELWGRRNSTVDFVVGKPVDGSVLHALKNDAARTALMRIRCEQLGVTKEDVTDKIWPVPVAQACPHEQLQQEGQKFLDRETLATEGRYAVFAIQGHESSCILQEIGRLREETFRLVGEGSGNERDTDSFDKDYTHLVLWDVEKNTIAGAYRVRCFMPEEAHQSQEKLYLASLFDIQTPFYEQCANSMELGRAFVKPEYQRDYVPLMLLWKGIGRMIVRHKLRTLFGPCSMGLGYTDASAHILRQTLEANHWEHDLCQYTQGKRQPRDFAGPNAPNVQGLDYKMANKMVKDIEGDKGLPILFKHYLQLGGRIAAFHEDKDFGTLDALLVVDLAHTPEKVLLRYMSPQEVTELKASYGPVTPRNS